MIPKLDFRITDRDLLRLFTEDSGPAKGKFPPRVIERFFAAMDDVLAANEIRDLSNIRGYNVERVPRECEGCYSLRLGSQFRLIFRIDSRSEVDSVFEVVDVRDYH